MKTPAIFLFVLSTLVVQSGAVAADKHAAKSSPGTTSQTKSSPTQLSRPTPFDLDVLNSGRIDPHLSGVPIAELIGALQKATQLTKGEFESTAEFTARKEKALSGQLLGKIGINDLIAFTLPVTKNGAFGRCGVRYEYNADASEVRLFTAISYNQFNGIGGPDYHLGNGREHDNLTLDIAFGNSNTYEASNAYGAKVTVKEITAKRYGIVTPGGELGRSRSSSCQSTDPLFKLAMTPELAAKELPSLKALVVVKLEQPYLVYHFDHAKPTRDDPTEVTVNWVYLYGEVVSVAFYSGSNGQILARYPGTAGTLASD